MLADVALAEHRGGLGVDAAGDELRGGDPGAAAQHLGVGRHRERVQVGDEVVGVEVLLQPDPVHEGTEEVAEVEGVARRLHPGEDARACGSGRCGGGHGAHCVRGVAPRLTGMTRVVDTHRQVFGADPDGVWSAPGRVNLIGEHTDYNDGLVLPIALPHRTDAACSPRADDLLRVWSVQTDELVEVQLGDVGPGRPEGWAAYVAGVLWALRAEGHAVRGLDVTVDSAVPVGAGLSSSAALECAVGAAASDLFGLGLLADDAGRARLAAACVRAENEVAGAPTGGMDQSAALLCRADHALLLDCRSGATEHVPFDLAGRAQASGDAAASGEGTASGHVLLVTDTRAEHSLNDGQYGERRVGLRAGGGRARGGLAARRRPGRPRRRPGPPLRRRAAPPHPPRGHRDRAGAGDGRGPARRRPGRGRAAVRRLARLAARRLRGELRRARRLRRGGPVGAGALGARMTGGGFGGSSIALLPAGAVDDAIGAITAAFAERGWREPQCFVVTAGAAAHRNP